MTNLEDRVLHLQVETEEMYGVFSPDRSRLLNGGDGPNPKVRIWDVQTGNCLRVLNEVGDAVDHTCNDHLIGVGVPLQAGDQLHIGMFACGTWLPVIAFVS